MAKFTKDMLLEAVQQSSVKLSNGKKMKVRAFLMKEYKIMMLANESESSMEDAMMQVLKNCIVDNAGIDVETLPIFDIETLYLTVWKLSKGTSVVPVSFICQNMVDELDDEGNPVMHGDHVAQRQCSTPIKVNANLARAKLSRVPESMIKLSDKINVKMRYPTVYESEFFNVEKESDLFDITMRCVEEVHMNGEIMKVGEDIQPNELIELLDYIDANGYEKMAKFVNDIPQTTLDVAVKCPHCGHSEAYTLRGLSDFFD
ncbi:baseplate hub subunit [Aeromonas phage AsFcp_4]|uniref:Gp26 baseplate hub subunit n=1 Tax=Aeromonas phage PX29 TaxID=926067 RepID=E5DQB6_9CAUD|nr:gp26 baseplate hub subunit [Aeromonas phage PX29]ADQ52902.1 gp26 baseplate hub subunit [Aeromonas phage PX29]QAX98445.1 baseplate hub subunit [Aeromonas phage AsFcp_2]QAX99477.1 baseplate hub subunit [Aeromonas phage AsFcp_4]